MSHVLVVPEVVLAAAAELDALADRLTATVATHAPATHVAASGSEEVSTLAAAHFNEHATAHEQVAATGIAELRNAATTLRTQVANYLGQDAEHAAGLTQR